MDDAAPSPRIALWLPVGVMWLLAAIPIAVWSGMFVHALRAWRFLGRWPAPDNPAPKALPPALQTERIEGWVMGAIVALIIILGIQFTRRSSWKVRFIAAAAGVVILWVGWFVISRLDPGHVVAWSLR